MSRPHVIALLTAWLVAPPALALAQPAPAPQDVLPSRSIGWIDFGARGTTVSGDADRFERYRDVGDGAFLERLRWGWQTTQWMLTATADNAGRRDQRYRGLFEQFGRIRASFEWDQIPLRISGDTRSPYREEGPGVLRLDDDIQRRIQAGELTLAGVVPLAQIVETQYRRDVAAANVLVTVNPETDLRGSVSTANRQGSMPWGAPFGFNLAVEVPAPIDSRTTDARLALDWARGAHAVRVAYDGSWYQNDIDTLIWDNPIRLTDTTSPTAYTSGNGTSTGRMALWPNNQMHTVSATGSFALARRTRLSGTFAIGQASQNDQILPHTINTAIPSIDLERELTNAEARILAANLQFTARPWRTVGLTARYRLHDRENNTAPFHLTQKVRMDQVLESFTHEGPDLYSVRRDTLDLEASFTPLRYTAFRVGYGRAASDRTFRVFEETVENTFRASVDVTGNAYLGLRAQVERGNREGDGLDLHVLEAVGEQPGMRHYDVADRDRTRFTAMATLTPLAFAGVHGAITVGNDDFDDSRFGLQNNDHRVYSAGLDLTLARAGLSFSFANESYETFQLSRQANPGPQFTDPTRDWGVDADERVNSILSSVDFPGLVANLDLRLTYDFSRSETDYIYELGNPAAERTLPDDSPVTSLPPVQQLPQVSNDIHMLQLDSRYYLTRDLAVGLVYWFERYRVEDYALGDETIRGIDLPGGLLMYYRYRPYTAHSVWGRITYVF